MRNTLAWLLGFEVQNSQENEKKKTPFPKLISNATGVSPTPRNMNKILEKKPTARAHSTSKAKLNPSKQGARESAVVCVVCVCVCVCACVDVASSPASSTPQESLGQFTFFFFFFFFSKGHYDVLYVTIVKRTNNAHEILLQKCHNIILLFRKGYEHVDIYIMA